MLYQGFHFWATKHQLLMPVRKALNKITVIIAMSLKCIITIHLFIKSWRVIAWKLILKRLDFIIVSIKIVNSTCLSATSNFTKSLRCWVAYKPKLHKQGSIYQGVVWEFKLHLLNLTPVCPKILDSTSQLSLEVNSFKVGVVRPSIVLKKSMNI